MEEEFYGKVIFLEDYSMDMARHLVQGVDVWLNTPRLPMEACGTSGMKACFNGGIHCSVPDGWWAEAYRPGIGWSIGSGEEYEDPELQDRLEAKALYNIIENQIIPIFYDRDRNDIPVNWLRIVKESMKVICPVFSSNRMLGEYVSSFYIPAFKNTSRLIEGSYAGARELAGWMEKIRQNWSEVTIESVDAEISNGTCSVGDPLPVTVGVRAPGMEPDDLLVEVQHGKIEHDGWLTHRESVRLKCEKEADGLMVFTGSFRCSHSGHQGFTVRILPSHGDFGRIIEPNMVCWWE
jgi:starch phosphorylase